MIYFLAVAAIIGYVLALFMCLQESRKRKINFVVAIMLCIFLTPVFSYFIIVSFPLRNARGCKWCGNKRNEAEFCGLCGKNETGELRA